MKDGGTRRSYAMACVDRTVAVLGALVGNHEGLTLAEVARRAQLDEATALRYLRSLASHDLVTRDEKSGRHSLGLGLFQLGQQAGGIADVRKLALPHMERLLEQFEETVNVGYAHQHRLVVIEVLESKRSIRKGATVGEVDVWHASALGKAILSSLPESQAVEILDSEERIRYTERTKVEIGDLLDDLRVTRERGFAIDDEEFEEGLRCVAAAIIGYRGAPSHALSISGFAPRMSSRGIVERMGAAVAQAAAEISQSLGFTARREGFS
jgi:IclR family acetate operon transcriptional repressor